MVLHRYNARDIRRRGAIYVVVLYSSIIVAAVGLAALQLARIQHRTATANIEFTTARTYARAALEIGMLKIREDPYWRTNLGNGTWVTNQTIGSGTFSISAVDPIDGNVAVGDNHPIILTGIGRQGTAVFKTSVRLEVGPRVGSCLEVSMISGGHTSISSATLNSDQFVSANHNFSSNGGSTVNANVEAHGNIVGSTYTQAKLQRTTPRDLPDPTRALDYYLAQGVTIPYTSLTQWSQSELIANGDFETNTSGWYPLTNCRLQRSSAQARSGLHSLRVRQRDLSSDVAAHDLPVNSISRGNKYRLSIPVFSGTAGTARAVLTLTSTGDGVQSFTSAAYVMAKDTWTNLTTEVTPNWTGNLVQATVSIWSSIKNDYFIDKVSLIDITYPNGYYVIDRCLISPTVNPFGATNAQGIYIINCDGKNVILGRSRIVGTLVFLNPGGNTAIQDSVNWETAVYNFPALLTTNKLNIGIGSAGLSETVLGINLNPAGTPYPFSGGTENATTTDSYPSRITGLVYSQRDLVFSNSPSLTGVVIVNEKIEVNANSLNLSFGNTYLNDPPPGFDVGTITMKAVPSTWQRTVD